MTRRTRKHYSPQDKVAILRQHLVDKTPVSDICDQHQIHPTLFYQWQKQFFERGAAAFERKADAARSQTAAQRQMDAMQQKLQRRDEVIAELMQEHVQLKKELGEP